MATTWDESLTSEQRTVASHHGSHGRLLAGPGTGKSFTIARRIAYLVQEQEVSADQVMILTFTRNATRELKKSIFPQLEPFTEQRPYISTLHGFSLRQLRKNSHLLSTLPQPLRIADDWEEHDLINSDLSKMTGLSRKKVEDGFRSLSSDWETLNYESEGWLETVPDAMFVGAWQEQRGVYGYMLRSELVYQLKKAIQQNPEFLLDPSFSHLIIDEYQDLNPCDLAIVEAAAANGAEIFAVGDDDQSIYGFRNADPKGIKDFLTTFPGSADLTLTECRRCDEEILRKALWVAEQDYSRIAKTLHASEGRTGGEVRLLRFANDRSERKNLAKLIRFYIDTGTKPEEILILFRSDHRSVLSNPLISELTELGIPVATSIESNPIMSSAIGRKILAHIHLCFDPEDSLAWRTIIELTQGVGQKTVDAIYKTSIEQGVTFGHCISIRDTFAAQVPNGQRTRLLTSIHDTDAILNSFNAKRDLLLESEGEISVDSLQSLISDLISNIAKNDSLINDIQSYFAESIQLSQADNLNTLLAYLAVDQGISDADVEIANVNIMTMHQAKGLTADVVFIVAAEDEIFPRTSIAREVADDRRLLYVSMTRARHKLIISYCNRRDGQQTHTGRNSGDPTRTLTRLLQHAPLTPEDGVAFVNRVVPQ